MKKNIVRCALVSVLFGGGPTLYAQTKDMSSGNYWLSMCQSRSDADQMVCMAYIRGVWDGMSLQQMLTGTKQFFCVPEKVTVGQIKDVVVKHLRDNPKDRHMSGEILIGAAIARAYPCPQSQP